VSSPERDLLAKISLMLFFFVIFALRNVPIYFCCGRVSIEDLQADPTLKALFAKSVLEKANIYDILCWFILSKE